MPSSSEIMVPLCSAICDLLLHCCARVDVRLWADAPVDIGETGLIMGWNVHSEYWLSRNTSVTDGVLYDCLHDSKDMLGVRTIRCHRLHEITPLTFHKALEV